MEIFAVIYNDEFGSELIGLYPSEPLAYRAACNVVIDRFADDLLYVDEDDTVTQIVNDLNSDEVTDNSNAINLLSGFHLNNKSISVQSGLMSPQVDLKRKLCILRKE